MLSTRLFTRRAVSSAASPSTSAPSQVVSASAVVLSSWRENSAEATSNDKKESGDAQTVFRTKRGNTKKKKNKEANTAWEQHEEWNANQYAGEMDGDEQQQQQQQQNQDEYADPQPTFEDTYADLIAAHRVLGTRPGDPLYRIKLSYMMRCRESHPEVDGNPATFYKISLAYERIMKDRGIEMRDGRIVHSESVPKLPRGHDPLADTSRELLLRAAEEIPGVDRYERSAALDRLREDRMALSGTSEMLAHPSLPPVSEMKALEHLELVEDILLAPQPLQGMAWHEQPFRMLTSEVREREGDAAAKLLEEIVAPVRLKIGGVVEEQQRQIAAAAEAAEAIGETKQLAENAKDSKDAAAAALSAGGASAGSAAATSTSTTEGKSLTTMEQKSSALRSEDESVFPGVSNKLLSMMDAEEKKELLDQHKYESRCLAPSSDELTPEVMYKADEIGKRADEEKGVLKFEQPEATARVTNYLGPGTQVVAARQFEALGRAGKMSTYARYSNFPHPPKKLEQLPEDLEESHMLRPEEEEAVARTVINKQLQDGKVSPETIMNYLGRSSSVAGMAAQTATTWMESTEERKNLFTELSLFLALSFALLCCALATLAAWIRYHQVFGDENSQKRQKQQYLNLETMLPWWGNDAMYETSVKRIFLEEYKKGRQAAEQMKHYQAGLEQETLTPAQKKQLELDVFKVSAGDVQRMRQKVKSQAHVKPEEPAAEEYEEEVAALAAVSSDNQKAASSPVVAAAAAATAASSTASTAVSVPVPQQEQDQKEEQKEQPPQQEEEPQQAASAPAVDVAIAASTPAAPAPPPVSQPDKEQQQQQQQSQSQQTEEDDHIPAAADSAAVEENISPAASLPVEEKSLE